MTREIKFRAWDNHNHEMVDIGQSLMSYKGWEIMQYTGLKDKNGKEIYEGDIIAKNYNNYIHNEEVEWSDYGGFKNIYCSNKVEIIGNIYENPELLD